MITSLSAKKQDGIFRQKPSTTFKGRDSFHAMWKRCDNAVIPQMVHSVLVSIHQSTLDIYSQGGLKWNFIYEVKEVSAIKQGDLNVTDYFTKIWIIWDQLANLDQIQFPFVLLCTCSAIYGALERKAQDQVIQLLRCLKDQYWNVNFNILWWIIYHQSIMNVFSYTVRATRCQIMNNMIGSMGFEARAVVDASNSNQNCTDDVYNNLRGACTRENQSLYSLW